MALDLIRQALCIGLCLCIGLQGAAAQVQGLFGTTNQGDATYYTTSYGSGACSFAFGSVQYSPWVSGTNAIVAINAPQYFGSQTCGLCLSYQGLGPGSGANPVSRLPQYAIVGDLCPECKSGDLDQALTGDGRWTVSWKPLQCNVGSSNFMYSFQGSNSYYLKLQVANTRVPVLSVSIKYNGSFRQMDRVSDNYFVMFANGGQAFTLPTALAITSVLNDTVYDTLATSSPTGNVPGGTQFPLSSRWGTVGISARMESFPPPTSPVRSPPPASLQARPPLSPQNGTRSPPPVRAASPPPLAGRSPPPPSTPRRPPPPPTPTTTPVSNLSATPLGQIPFVRQGNGTVQTAIVIPPYQQCGGAGAGCFGTNCKDAPFSGTTCAADGSGQQFGCTRINQYYYQCLPQRLAAAQNAAIESVAELPAPPSGSAESGAPCALPVADYGQCGGNSGFCSSSNDGAACTDAAWREACCSSERFTCRRFTAAYWECRDQPFTA